MRRQRTAAYGRAYFMTQKKRKRRRNYQVGLLLGICLLACAVFFVEAGKRQSTSEKQPHTDRVYAIELAGYLQVAYLTPEETRSLLIPELQEELEKEDIILVLKKLGLETYTDEIMGQAGLEDGVKLTREQWNQIYELLLEKLQVKESVMEVELQFLGKVAGESRIMADNGNYDCDLISCRMEYGKKYVVYVQGNLILGIKYEKETEGKEEAAQNQERTDAGAETSEASVVIPKTIRVLLTQDHGQQPYRTELWLKSDTEWKLSDGKREEVIAAGELRSGKDWLENGPAEEAVAEPLGEGKLFLTDASGKENGCYRGKLHFYKTEAGIWVVNELDMESYLYGVVPGEMPATFAAEALRAQAVCARTYAAKQALETAYEAFHADVDDTTACQVYLPVNENAAATDAVNATAGEVLTYEGKLASVYYFSTSCGYTTGLEVWQQDAVPYLGSVSLLKTAEEAASVDDFLKDWSVQAYDSESRFFRWKGELHLLEHNSSLQEKILAALQKHDGKLQAVDQNGQTAADSSGFGTCTGLRIDQRAASDAVTDLAFIYERGEVHVYNENLIRTFIWTVCSSLTDKNGGSVNTIRMLPSAFFTLQDLGNGTYEICGGGLGHGIGMSQYGADGMAKSGSMAAEILQAFFPGTVMVKCS